MIKKKDLNGRSENNHHAITRKIGEKVYEINLNFITNNVKLELNIFDILEKDVICCDVDNRFVNKI